MGNIVSGFIKEPQFENSISKVEDLLRQNKTLIVSNTASSLEQKQKGLINLLINNTDWIHVVNIASSLEQKQKERQRLINLLINNTDWIHVVNNAKELVYCRAWKDFRFDNSKCGNDTWEYHIKYHVHGNRTEAFRQPYLFLENYLVEPKKKNWWRSQPIHTENKSTNILNPYNGPLTARNWIRNEVHKFNNFLPH